MSESEKPSFIVRGQSVSDEKIALCRQLRRNMTPSESSLWQRLRANKLGGFHFRRQQIVSGFIADFYCHRAALAVELDGSSHDNDYDSLRDEVFAGKGIKVIRFANHLVVNDIETVLHSILDECRIRSEVGPTC